MQKFEFKVKTDVEGMRTDANSAKLQNVLLQQAGVQHAEVDLKQNRVAVTTDLDEEVIRNLIYQAGYHPY